MPNESIPEGGRPRIEMLVRQLEGGALAYAASLIAEQERAERIVEEAFLKVLPSLPASAAVSEAERRLRAAIAKLAGHRAGAEPFEGSLPVGRSLHLRIVDGVEERQQVDGPPRSRLAIIAVMLALLVVAGLVKLQLTRNQALAAAAPIVSETTPARNASEVPLDGSFYVTFGRRPLGTPTLTLSPTDGTRQPPHWDGNTLAVQYAGLHFAAHYSLTLRADYKSNLHDLGHFQQSWSFTAEGYPRLIALTPADGAASVPREGQFSIAFNKRPRVEPTITLQPTTATLQQGQWNGATWTVPYTGLKPLTRYTGQLTVAAHGGAAAIHSTWAFTAEPGPPPAGVPVVWYSTANPNLAPSQTGGPYRLVALDWSGAQVGTLYSSDSLRQNLDGSLLTSQSGAFMDSGGQVIVPASWGGNRFVVSDDSRHYCDVPFVESASQFWLVTGTLGGSTRRVAPLGPGGTYAGPAVLACNSSRDRAVVGDAGQSGFLNVRVYALSTGRLLYRHDYTANPQGLTISADGRYLAEQPLGAAGAILIRRMDDGAIVARLGAVRVVAFSGDDTRLITASAWGGSGPNEIQMLDWRTNKVLWRLAGDPTGPGQQVYALARPQGSDFIVGVGRPSGSGDLDGLWLVHADGGATRLVSDPVFLAALPG